MLLTAIVFLPLVGALLVMLAGGRGDRPDREGTVRTVALIVSLVEFAATLYLWMVFNPASADFQFVERRAWLPQFGITYHVGVDGISLFLIVLTGFLTPLALLSSWQSVHKSVKLFSSVDGMNWTAGAVIYDHSEDTPLETELVFMPSGKLLALVRMDGNDEEVLGNAGRLIQDSGNA